MLADAFPRLPTKDNNYKSQQKGNIEDASFNSIFDNQELFKCLQHIPAEECYTSFPQDKRSPIDFKNLQEQQLEDQTLFNLQEQKPGNFPVVTFNGVDLIYYQPDKVVEGFKKYVFRLPFYER